MVYIQIIGRVWHISKSFRQKWYCVFVLDIIKAKSVNPWTLSRHLADNHMKPYESCRQAMLKSYWVGYLYLGYLYLGRSNSTLRHLAENYIISKSMQMNTEFIKWNNKYSIVSYNVLLYGLDCLSWKADMWIISNWKHQQSFLNNLVLALNIYKQTINL